MSTESQTGSVASIDTATIVTIASRILDTQQASRKDIAHTFGLRDDQAAAVMAHLAEHDVITSAGEYGYAEVLRSEHASDHVLAELKGMHICDRCVGMEHPGRPEDCVLCKHYCPECTARDLIIEHGEKVREIETERDEALDRAATAEAAVAAVEAFLLDARPVRKDAPRLVKRVSERLRRARLDTAVLLVPAALIVGLALGTLIGSTS